MINEVKFGYYFSHTLVLTCRFDDVVIELFMIKLIIVSSFVTLVRFNLLNDCNGNSLQLAF